MVQVYPPLASYFMLDTFMIFTFIYLIFSFLYEGYSTTDLRWKIRRDVWWKQRKIKLILLECNILFAILVVFECYYSFYE